MNDENEDATSFDPPVSPAETSPAASALCHFPDASEDYLYHRLTARAMHACVTMPGDGITLEKMVDRLDREMVNCHATGYNDMLHEHGHVLNALMTAMIERGMGAPDPFNTAISAALRAQKQFQDISRTRLMQTMDRIATEKWDDKKYNDSSKQNEQKWR